MNEGIKKKLETLGDIELTIISYDSGTYIQYPASENDDNKYYFVRIEYNDCAVFTNDNSEKLINIDHITEIEMIKHTKK